MTSLRIYHTEDADPKLVLKKQITVVGFGSQGSAFALNLRDSGCNVQVALRTDSPSRQAVLSERLPLRSLETAWKSDIIVFAIPDQEQPGFYRKHFPENDAAGRTLIFLHGLNIHFGNIQPNPLYDVVLIAPHGPGKDLRNKFVSGKGMSCFLAAAANHSGAAVATGLSVAANIGAGKAGIYETSFAHETLGDLFGEQTLLVGGLAGLAMAVFQTMVEMGIPIENAHLETVHQLRLLASLLEEHGPAGLIDRVSRTAAFGSLTAMDRLFDRQFRGKLEDVYRHIESGEFNRELMADAEQGFPKLRLLLSKVREHQAQLTMEQFNRGRSES
jgi:ketol-acid reductoisomerase